MTDQQKPGRGRPPKAKAETRGRPQQDESDLVRKLDSLDELEQRAKTRIDGGERIGLSPKLQLEYNEIEPGYHYEWGSDSPTYPISLQQMLEAGYTFVRFKHGSLRGDKMIKHSKGCNLYLMRCPQEYFEADEAVKHQKSIDQHKEIMQVGEREYAGDSKELGKGKVATLKVGDNPEQDPISLLEGE